VIDHRRNLRFLIDVYQELVPPTYEGSLVKDIPFNEFSYEFFRNLWYLEESGLLDPEW